jgi:hypothetical protein
MLFQRRVASILLIAAFLMAAGQNDGPAPRADAIQKESQKNSGPIVVSAQTLAQAVQDDVNAAAKKYHLTELQVDGVVTGQSASKGKVSLIKFELKVNDRKTNKMVDFTVFCGLKDPLPKGDKGLEDVAVGKTATVRGKSTAMGNGQVTLTGCIIVHKGDELKVK